MVDTTIDESIIKLTVNKFVAIVVAIVLATNTLSLTFQNVTYNAEKTKYLDEAIKRRVAHAQLEQDYKRKIDNLQQDLREMEEDVEEWKLKYNEK